MGPALSRKRKRDAAKAKPSTDSPTAPAAVSAQAKGTDDGDTTPVVEQLELLDQTGTMGATVSHEEAPMYKEIEKFLDEDDQKKSHLLQLPMEVVRRVMKQTSAKHALGTALEFRLSCKKSKQPP